MKLILNIIWGKQNFLTNVLLLPALSCVDDSHPMPYTQAVLRRFHANPLVTITLPERYSALLILVITPRMYISYFLIKIIKSDQARYEKNLIISCRVGLK